MKVLSLRLSKHRLRLTYITVNKIYDRNRKVAAINVKPDIVLLYVLRRLTLN